MSKVISFINRKGGTAKTTSAINVAIVLKRMGFGVVIIETDDNCSLGDLRELELTDQESVVENGYTAGKDFPELVQTDEDNAAALIQTLRMNLIDIVIVDGAANMSAEAARSIASNSDIVVVPTSLSKSEIMVTEKTIKDIRHDSVVPAPKIVVLVNRNHFLTGPETIERSLSRIPVPVLPIHIPHFKLYQNLSTMTPAGSYRDVTNLILKLLRDTPKQKSTSRSKASAL